MNAHPTAPALERRRLLVTLAAAGSALALAGCATEAAAQAQLASLELFDRDSGRLLPLYFKDGRQYAPGRPGARYALRVRNLTAARVMVVLSVDGVNVITGETADWRQTGYVLDPGRWYDINGWRKSDTQVAAFEFAALAQSYAARTGRSDEVGVIGMAVFRERLPEPPVARAPAPAAAARAEARADANEKSSTEDSLGSRLGTGHGQREWSVSRRTNFERASHTPDQVLQIEYDRHERLVAAGIIPGRTAGHRPRPFPSNEPGYVPDPPSPWR